MAAESAYDTTLRFVREHERGLIVAWIVGLMLVLGLGFGWGIVYRGAERAVDAYEARWPNQVDAGAVLVQQRRFDEAAKFLERLDAEFPAQSVKHRYDRERERLLTLLAQSYVELDKKTRALATCERLIAFDPRNWQNHFTRALTALFFGEDDLAKLSLHSVLAIHPTHLPSVEARVKLAMDASLFAEVPPIWRAYVEAYRLAPVDFSFGGTSASLEIPSDGHPHRFEVPFTVLEKSIGPAQFTTHGWSIDVRDFAFAAPMRVGSGAAMKFQSPEHGPWTVSDAKDLKLGRLAATNVGSSLQCEVSELPDGVARAAFEVVAYKTCTDSLWTMIETSYRNLLLWDELEAFRKRTRIGGCLEAGSLYED